MTERKPEWKAAERWEVTIREEGGLLRDTEESLGTAAPPYFISLVQRAAPVWP